MSEEKPHILPIKTHLLVLASLIVLTVITVLITSIELGPYNTAAAMFIASLKAVVVLLYFMHLRFDEKIYGIMFGLVIALFVAVITITFFDYLFR